MPLNRTKMKKTIGIIYLIIALIFQSCNSGNQPVEKSGIKTMLIKSNGEVSVQPDEAMIIIHLECINKNIKIAKECLIDKSEKLNKSILDFGIKQEDILTTSINQSKEYRWINNSSIFVGYKSSMTTKLTIRDLKILEELYTELLLNENISVGNLSYSHSNIDSLNNVAYQKALENANNIADQLLLKMKESEKEIIRIGNMNLPSVQDNSVYGYDKTANFEIKELGADKSRIRINSGTMYANKTLIVEYNIY